MYVLRQLTVPKMIAKRLWHIYKTKFYFIALATLTGPATRLVEMGTPKFSLAKSMSLWLSGEMRC